MARQVEYVELTIEPNFNKTFMQSLIFPHQVDKFPHLKHLLPREK
jgi:uncharacterized 2Fe-2S/4Fe-4S cluster protein (DUF4445 family)